MLIIGCDYHPGLTWLTPVTPYSAPSFPNVGGASGQAPSAVPPTKVWSVVKTPWGVILKIVPALPVPNVVVPYRLPSEPNASPPCGKYPVVPSKL
jgi:hypothetical protein